MGMKKTLGLLTAMAMMGSNAYGLGNNEPQETEEEKKKRLERKQKKAEIERNKANGLIEFFYGENSVWALNQKTADKKAKKKGFL
jgi:hypothetical protein